jgi:chemotaxis protein MotB
MARRRTEDIHVNHERWLVSYADFITLLFAFFVVMYSISQVNQSKYRVLSQTFTQAFNSPSDPTANPNVVNNLSPSKDIIVPIETEKTLASDVEKAAVAESPEDSAKQDLAGRTNLISRKVPNDELNQISDRVNEKFAQLINDKMIKVSSNEFWLQIELSDSILFSSASADPSKQAQAIFTEIAGILKNYTNSVQIEGFTDNVPMSSGRYPTNWELSAARAVAIVKWLVIKGVQPERLGAVGYGEFQPIANNNTEAGRAQNRRVAVMIAKRKIERPKANVK